MLQKLCHLLPNFRPLPNILQHHRTTLHNKREDIKILHVGCLSLLLYSKQIIPLCRGTATTCLMLRCFYPVVIKENQSDEESHPLIPGVTQWSELLRFHHKSSLTSPYVNCRVADVNRKSHSGTRRQFAVLRERAWGEYYANSKC